MNFLNYFYLLILLTCIPSSYGMSFPKIILSTVFSRKPMNITLAKAPTFPFFQERLKHIEQKEVEKFEITARLHNINEQILEARKSLHYANIFLATSIGGMLASPDLALMPCLFGSAFLASSYKVSQIGFYLVKKTYLKRQLQNIDTVRQ